MLKYRKFGRCEVEVKINFMVCILNLSQFSTIQTVLLLWHIVGVSREKLYNITCFNKFLKILELNDDSKNSLSQLIYQDHARIE